MTKIKGSYEFKTQLNKSQNERDIKKKKKIQKIQNNDKSLNVSIYRVFLSKRFSSNITNIQY